MSEWELKNPEIFGLKAAVICKDDAIYVAKVFPDSDFFNPYMTVSLAAAKARITYEFKTPSDTKRAKWEQTK